MGQHRGAAGTDWDGEKMKQETRTQKIRSSGNMAMLGLPACAEGSFPGSLPWGCGRGESCQRSGGLGRNAPAVGAPGGVTSHQGHRTDGSSWACALGQHPGAILGALRRAWQDLWVCSELSVLLQGPASIAQAGQELLAAHPAHRAQGHPSDFLPFE